MKIYKNIRYIGRNYYNEIFEMIVDAKNFNHISSILSRTEAE